MQKNSFSGNYIAYGVREHAMAGIMNGLALSGFLPFGGTFLVFSDYMRHSIRLSALMGLRVFYIMTHDSIGLGEDGPTHQPIEHLASLRAIPNLFVFRPCDAIETAECYEVASGLDAPSLFALSRQNLPFLRNDAKENLSAKGGYIIHACQNPEYTIIATGSEVSLAIEVAKASSKQIRVVSMPCLEIFRKQDENYKKSVLGNDNKINCKRIFIEAATINSFWGLYREEKDLHFTINTFGHSGKDVDVYKEFGLTVENIVKNI
jgi:transketolase